MKCASEEPLYVILPYFNFCGFKRRRDLFVDFVRRNKSLRLVVIECDGPAPLGKLGVWKHIRVKSPNHIWIKESLINQAVRRLPKSWKYMAWVDADITFLNEGWVEDTVYELRKHDMVQLFRTCVNLGPDGESIKTDKSFGHMLSTGTEYSTSDKYGFWHPGYAWACSRKAYDQMGGLLDWAILGSGDRHMALAWIGRVAESAPGNVHPTYARMLLEYQERCRGLKVSYIEGTIVHHWHGRFVDRKYKERWKILTDGQYDPADDVGITKDGMIRLSLAGSRFRNQLKEYFVGRKEDLMSV
jgi:hypothetical protein